ncbi:Myb DNA-bind 5 domain-containing protein, partial [Aphis craccivora]
SWRDLKTKVSKKATTLRHAKRLTGNKSIELQELSDVKKKFLGIVGHEYIEGTDCPDSFPEELPDSIEELSKGNTNILNVVPTSITTETYEYNEDDDIVYGNIEIIEDATLNMDNSNASLHIIPRTTEAASCSQTENQPITNVKKKYVKLISQFNTARDVFTNLANINSQQMDLITSTLSTIAENNKIMAMVKMAVNDERRTQME